MSCQMENKMNFVKIGKEGGRIVEYAVLPGVTIQDILNISLVTFGPDESVYVNNIKQTGDWRKEKALDRSCIIIKRDNVISVKVARIGESLITVKAKKGLTVNEVILLANRKVYDYEDIWVHKEGELRGRKIVGYDFPLDGDILVIEPKNNQLKERLRNIVSAHEGLDTLYSNDCLEEIIKLVKQS